MTLLASFIADLNRATPDRLDELGRQLKRLEREATTDAERDVVQKIEVLFHAGRERRKVLENVTVRDVVVTVPKNFTHPCAPGLKGLAAWLAEGDPAGSEWSGIEWDFTTSGGRPQIEPGDRVYVVCEGKLVGYAPLIRVECDGSRVTFIRGGGAVACTIAEPITGFRGWRYRFWNREDEILL